MKNLILGIAVLGLAIACKNTDNTSISDSSTAAAPEACAGGSCEGDTGCDMDAAGCDMDAAGCDMKADAGCDKAAAGCDSDAQVCPVTGQVIEN